MSTPRLPVALALLLPWAALAQPGKLRFERFTADEGLPQKQIICMLQDHRGFLWVGTSDDLVRYDGYRFTSFRQGPEADSLAYPHVRDLHEDQEGRLWVATYGGGLDLFDPAEERFIHYRHDPEDPQSLAHDKLWRILEDKSGKLWISTHGGGLDRFDPETGVFTHYRHAPGDPASLASDLVYDLHEDDDGVLWVATNSGLDRFDPETGVFTHYHHDPDDPASPGGDLVRKIEPSSRGGLWLGTWGGLDRFDPETGTFTHYRHDPGNPQSLASNRVNALYEDDDGVLWVGTQESGLSRLDPQSGAFHHSRFSLADPWSLSDDRVVALYRDRSGLLWIATFAGLNMWNPLTEAFVHHGVDLLDPNSLSGPRVRSVYEDRSGILWVGTTEGLNRLDPETGVFTHYRHDPTDPTSLPHDHVSTILEDRRGDLWVGTPYVGMARLDRESGVFTHYRHDPTDPTSLALNDVIFLHEDRAGRFWVGTWGAGLDLFDRERGTFVHHRHDPAGPASLERDTLLTVQEGASGELWLGSWGSGVDRFDPETGTFTHYQPEPGSHPLSVDRVFTLYQDDSGGLWLGTWGGGLGRLDPADGSFRFFTEEDGLAGNGVVGILPDDEGRLWIATLNGLSRFDPELETFMNFDVSDGLQGNEFNIHSAWRGHDGRLYFGGNNGLTAFDPAAVRINDHVPPVVLTSFEVFRRPLRFERPLGEVEEVELSFEDTSIAVEFAALDFAAPRKNRYAYRLDGVDDDWVEIGTRHDVAWSHLGPRSYLLHVRGSNNHGVWNEDGVELRITITPPPWGTWWFRVTAMIAVVALTYGGYRARVRGVEARSRALEAEIAQRRKVEEALRASETKFSKAFHASPDSVSIRSRVTGHYVEVNEGFERLTGYSPDETVGRTIEDLGIWVSEEDRVEVQRTLAERGSLHGFETPIRTRSGEIRTVMLSAEVVDLHDEPCVLAVTRDISERKEVERERERLIAELEAKNTELERFTYTVSHDLKSPLFTIKGFLGFVRRDAESGDREKLERDLAQIEGAAQTMGRLLDGLLELSRIGRLVNPSEELALTEVAREAAGAVAGQIAERGAVLEIAPDLPVVTGDRIRLVQVFQNLIDNAVKFMGDEASPRIEVGWRRDDQETVVVYVRDNGAGIEVKDHDRVFGLFDRLGSNAEGTGIGLTLVRRIVEVHGGRTWVESEGKGKGSTFCFVLGS